jgi:hypothetical protein
MRSSLQKNVNPECITIISAKIDKAEADPDNSDNAVWFSGSEAHKYGLANVMAPSTEELADIYITKCSSPPEEDAGLPFFMAAQKAKKNEELSQFRKSIKPADQASWRELRKLMRVLAAEASRKRG